MRTVPESYVGAMGVTPSNTDNIAQTRAIMVSATGDLSLVFADGSTAKIVGADPGIVYPFAVRKVMSTDTTATGIVALY